jgi:hypothetical protein
MSKANTGAKKSTAKKNTAKKSTTVAKKAVKKVVAKKIKVVAGDKNPKKNPYRAGKVYAIGFTAIQKAKIITRSALLEVISSEITTKRKAAVADGTPQTNKKGEDILSELSIMQAAEATTTVLLSPRDESKVREGADCRGNASAMGHIYYMEALKHKKGEEKRFRFRWRTVVLESRSYSKVKPAVEVKQTKTAAKAPVKAKAKKSKAKKSKAKKKVEPKVEPKVEAPVETPETENIEATA